MTATIHHGDCIEVMASLPTESVDAIVTSPPYAEQRKSTYGGIPEKDYPAWTVAWMTEAKRVLKPDGSVILNVSPHKSNGGLSDYVLRTRLAVRGAGWTELDEIIWNKPNAMPTGSPRRPKRSWESLLWYGKHGRAWSNAKAAGTPPKNPNDRRGTSGAGRAASNGWAHDINGGRTPLGDIVRVTNVLTLSKQNTRGVDHPAPFPWQLAEWCGKLVCPPGGTILDPFSGSASTGVAAIRNGWDYVGIDSIEEYVTMSRERLAREAA